LVVQSRSLFSRLFSSGLSKTYTRATAVLVDEVCPLPYANGGSLGWPRARSFCSTRRDVAVLEEGQDPVDSSGTLFGFVPLSALQSGALSSSVY
jgi:hypothetical protein